MKLKSPAILVILILTLLIGTQARLRNPWVVADKHINLWSVEKIKSTNDHYQDFAAYDETNPDLFFQDLIGETMVWEHRAEGNGVLAAFEDFSGNIAYCKKNGYTFHDYPNIYREHDIQQMDYIKYVNTLGNGNCGIQNSNLISLYTQLGLESRGMSLQGNAHFVSDVYFNGGWHYYDLDEGGWVKNASGVTYGLDYLIENAPGAFEAPASQTSLGSHNYYWSYGTDLTFIKGAMQQPSYMYFDFTPGGADMSQSIRIGEKFERFWDALNSSYKIGEVPEQTPPVFGNGRITYEPNLSNAYADFLDGVYEYNGIQQTSSGIQANSGGAYAVWAVRSGNPIVQSTVTTSGSGITKYYSKDMGVTWNSFSSATDVAELYDYLLKVEISSGNTLNSLKIETITMLNPGALPRLRPGTNSCQFKMYENDETLTMHPDWSNSSNYDKYMVNNNNFTWKEAKTPDDYAYFPNYGQPNGGARGSYATLKIPGPEGGKVMSVSGYAIFSRQNGNTFWSNLNGWSESNSAQLKVSDNSSTGFSTAAYNTLHKNSSYATMDAMQASGEWGFGTQWASLVANRGEISSPGSDGYFQFYYNGADGWTHLRGMSAYAHYYINHLDGDYLNDITITHRWNKQDGSTGEHVEEITAEEINNGDGTVPYLVNISDNLSPQNPNNSIVMEVAGSVPMAELISNPVSSISSAPEKASAGKAVLSVYPVPSNPSTVISYATDAKNPIKALKIYSLNGQMIYNAAGDISGHSGTVHWNGTDSRGKALTSGVYVARLLTNSGASVSKKIFLMK
ncbi:MAG: T9SS type A sorting domain-containing protein [Fibrobacterota bacterium]